MAAGRQLGTRLGFDPDGAIVFQSAAAGEGAVSVPPFYNLK